MTPCDVDNHILCCHNCECDCHERIDMANPEPRRDQDDEVISFAAGLAIARAKRGLLTTQEIRNALDEAYTMGQRSMREQR